MKKDQEANVCFSNNDRVTEAKKAGRLLYLVMYSKDGSCDSILYSKIVLVDL